MKSSRKSSVKTQKGWGKKKKMLGTKSSVRCYMSLSCLIHSLYTGYFLYSHNWFSTLKFTWSYIYHFKSNFKFLSGSVWLAQLSFPYPNFCGQWCWDRYSRLGRETQILRMSDNYEIERISWSGQIHKSCLSPLGKRQQHWIIIYEVLTSNSYIY